jgi:hypothetical protein
MNVTQDELDEVIKVLEEDRAVHVQWAEWQEKHPNWLDLTTSLACGGPEHHRLWEARYTKVLNVVRRLAVERDVVLKEYERTNELTPVIVERNGELRRLLDEALSERGGVGDTGLSSELLREVASLRKQVETLERKVRYPLADWCGGPR